MRKVIPALSLLLLLTSLVAINNVQSIQIVDTNNISINQEIPEVPISNETMSPVNVTLGSPVKIAGNQSVQLMTPSGIYVNVTPSEGVEITINQTSTNTFGKIQGSYVSLGIYLEIEMNDTNLEIDATIAIPYNNSQISNITESSLELRFYNESTGNWDAVPSWVDIENKMIYGNTTHFSTWTATGVEVDQNQPPVDIPDKAVPGVPFEIKLGSPVAVNPGEKVELVTPSGISVIITPGEGVEITIDEFPANPKEDLPIQFTSIGVFLTIEMNETDVDIEATLELPYQASDIAGLAIETLTFRFYNENTGNWDAVPSWVDGNIVYGNTTHFSTWTVTGEDEAASESVPFYIFTPILGLITLTFLLRRKLFNSI